MSYHLTRLWNLQKLRPNKNKLTLYFKASHFLKKIWCFIFAPYLKQKKTYKSIIIELLKKFQQSSVFIFKHKETLENIKV
jgi:hypothetical protein